MVSWDMSNTVSYSCLKALKERITELLLMSAV
jgi:hypothetical protein